MARKEERGTRQGRREGITCSILSLMYPRQSSFPISDCKVSFCSKFLRNQRHESKDDQVLSEIDSKHLSASSRFNGSCRIFFCSCTLSYTLDMLGGPGSILCRIPRAPGGGRGRGSASSHKEAQRAQTSKQQGSWHEVGVRARVWESNFEPGSVGDSDHVSAVVARPGDGARRPGGARGGRRSVDSLEGVDGRVGEAADVLSRLKQTSAEVQANLTEPQDTSVASSSFEGIAPVLHVHRDVHVSRVAR
mmetsp:Transcript_93/g.212  ORF Transcript_93/g.212 Transcript_93/m.212 type:complete len:248 (-) Transcript_93:23-766(-)